MYIVPYFISHKQKFNKQYYTIHILTEGGTRIWSDTDTDIAAALEPNELIAQKTERILLQGQIIWFCQIDPIKTDIRSMYQWHELPFISDSHCWRQFYYILDGSTPFMSVPAAEQLAPFSLQFLFNSILKDKYVYSIDDGKLACSKV